MYSIKSLKIILTILSILVFCMFVMYYFVYKDIKIKNEHASSMLTDLSFQNSKQDYLISTYRVIQNLRTQITDIDKSIVANDGDVQFIEDIERVAHDNNLTINIDSLVVEDDQDFAQSGIVTLKINAKTKGSWASTYKFLSELESLPFKVKVSKFGFINTSGGINPGEKKPKITPDAWQSIFELYVLKYK